MSGHTGVCRAMYSSSSSGAICSWKQTRVGALLVIEALFGRGVCAGKNESFHYAGKRGDFASRGTFPVAFEPARTRRSTTRGSRDGAARAGVGGVSGVGARRAGNARGGGGRLRRAGTRAGGVGCRCLPRR